MTFTIEAIYSGGVLRPRRPLALEEGETVELTVARFEPNVSSQRNGAARRLQQATSIPEWVAATKLLPPDDGGYDILRALEDSRALSGV